MALYTVEAYIPRDGGRPARSVYLTHDLHTCQFMADAGVFALTGKVEEHVKTNLRAIPVVRRIGS